MRSIKKLLITGSGGSPATNFVRSLRGVKEPFYLVGTDCHPHNLLRSETDSYVLVPRATELDYIDFLNDVIKEYKLEFLHNQNDYEISAISKNRDKLEINTFLPDRRVVAVCQDKYQSHLLWKKRGLPQPRTFFVNSEEDLKYVFEQTKGKIWLRYTGVGAGATGAIPTENYDLAKAWLDLHKGWGSFSAAELLTPNSVTWQSIWKDGELIVAQGRKRLSWEMGHKLLSGVSGATGAAVTVADEQVDKIAQEAIFAIDKNPNGIFSVDMTYDNDRIPNPTEINIGRFFTTHQFFTKAGLNMPYIYIKLAYKETIPEIPKKLNPLPSNLVWIRGIDFHPILSQEKTIQKCLEEYEKRKEKISRK